MSKNLDGIVAKIRDVRAQKRPEIEKNLQKIDALLAALRDTRGRASDVAKRYPDLATALQGVSFNDAENKLLEARAACETALTRLRRDSINIGVAGKARQGKSQILQMLTGLGDEQIPTGDGGFCTASRSIVRNGAPQSATVYYLTEAKLLKDKVAPSYAPVGSSPVALGLSPQPVSIAAFVAAELPTVSDTASVEALENWKKVKALQDDLRANPSLVSKLGAPPESVPLNTVRKYLVKDNGEADYQVVDHVEVVTQFEMDLPNGMTVYDLPGLEDPTPGIRETMLKSVSEDADIVRHNSIDEIRQGPQFELIWPTTVWGGMYRTGFFKGHNIKFDTGATYGEDQAVNLICNSRAEKIVYCSENLYNYVNNPNSLCRNSNFEKYSTSHAKSVNVVYEDWKANGYFENDEAKIGFLNWFADMNQWKDNCDVNRLFLESIGPELLEDDVLELLSEEKRKTINNMKNSVWES